MLKTRSIKQPKLSSSITRITQEVSLCTSWTLKLSNLAIPLTLSRAVIDVIDLERQEVLHMLDDVEDKESRIVGVISKCDTKQKQSHNWVS